MDKWEFFSRNLILGPLHRRTVSSNHNSVSVKENSRRRVIGTLKCIQCSHEIRSQRVKCFTPIIIGMKYRQPSWSMYTLITMSRTPSDSRIIYDRWEIQYYQDLDSLYSTPRIPTEIVWTDRKRHFILILLNGTSNLLYYRKFSDICNFRNWYLFNK